MNFWGYLIQGISDILHTVFLPLLPTHESLGLVTMIWKTADSTLTLLVIVVFSNFAMVFPMIVFGMISGFEIMRMIVGGILFILKIVRG